MERMFLPLLSNKECDLAQAMTVASLYLTYSPKNVSRMANFYMTGEIIPKRINNARICYGRGVVFYKFWRHGFPSH